MIFEYGTRELNEKYTRLKKTYKGKYFKLRHHTDRKNNVVRVVGITRDMPRAAFKLVYSEVLVEHKYCSLAGDYRKLRHSNTITHCMSESSFIKKFKKVDKENKEAFRLAWGMN